VRMERTSLRSVLPMKPHFEAEPVSEIDGAERSDAPSMRTWQPRRLLKKVEMLGAKERARRRSGATPHKRVD